MSKFLGAHKLILFATGAVIVAGSFGAYFVFRPGASPTLISVTRGDIREEVIVTGKTVAVTKRDLAFDRSGKVARILVDVGAQVHTGDVLVELDKGELLAQLTEAQAKVAAEQARLNELMRGTRTEDINITKADLEKIKQDLESEYAAVPAVLNDVYAKADDALRNQLNPLFSGSEGMNSNPQLTFTTSDTQAQIDAQTGRAQMGEELNAWKTQFPLLQTATRDKLEEILHTSSVRLTHILGFLNRVMDAILSSPSASAATYKTNVTSAREEINTALTNVTNAEQGIASGKTIVKQTEAKLALELAGTAPESVQAQQAAWNEAQAGVGVVSAQLSGMELRAPVDGIITKQNAKTGEVISAHTTVVSLINEHLFKIEANIPETDIGKVAVGEFVEITFDAFPGEIFKGNVTETDPAETIVDGVVNFKTTVVLESRDARIKSGLTANLSIETAKHAHVLMLPQAAIIEKKQGIFVKKYAGGITAEQPVRIGIRDANGNTEILSGIEEGDKVVNVGLKPGQ